MTEAGAKPAPLPVERLALIGAVEVLTADHGVRADGSPIVATVYRHEGLDYAFTGSAPDDDDYVLDTVADILDPETRQWSPTPTRAGEVYGLPVVAAVLAEEVPA